jgi:antitoxin ParD1/3/4
MNVRVKPETEAWLKAEVDKGHFGSIEEAVETIVLAHQAAAIDVAADDHAWAKPLIDEALAALDRGEGSPLDDVVARLKDRIAARQ